MPYQPSVNVKQQPKNPKREKSAQYMIKVDNMRDELNSIYQTINQTDLSVYVRDEIFAAMKALDLALRQYGEDLLYNKQTKN